MNTRILDNVIFGRCEVPEILLAQSLHIEGTISKLRQGNIFSQSLNSRIHLLLFYSDSWSAE